MIDLPKTFFISKRAPILEELDWMYTWLINNKKTYQMKTVLEFGCGITSWILNKALIPIKHVSMEAFQPCIDTTSKHVSNINFIKTTWDDIPKIFYDVLFVDASTNPPKNIVPINGVRIFREDAIKYCESFLAKNAIVILHDWNYKKEWQSSRRYVEKQGYKFLDGIKTKYGIGIYQKI